MQLRSPSWQYEYETTVFSQHSHQMSDQEPSQRSVTREPPETEPISSGRLLGFSGPYVVHRHSARWLHLGLLKLGSLRLPTRQLGVFGKTIEAEPT